MQKPIIRYVWNSTPDALAELVCRLKKHQFIKRKKELFALFENPYEDLAVQWDAACKPHLAYLLYRLFYDGYCRIRGSKGYFAFAEKHFTDFEGNPFAPESLKKLSSKINKNPGKYKDVIEEVKGILEDLE